jgi:hypothetical protein
MTKIKNNPIMKGASGMLGDVVVYREHRGTLIMSNRPKKRDVITPQQELVKSRFLRAVQYAKKQIADPITKAEYQPSPQSRITSAYAAAVADYLSAPVITVVDAGKYGGAVGDKIFIRATDDFKVMSVQVSISQPDGTLIEQGDAILEADAAEEYIYTATVATLKAPGMKVLVTVHDKPGNATSEETVLA